MMKKLAAALLAAAMTVSISAPAFAADLPIDDIINIELSIANNKTDNKYLTTDTVASLPKPSLEDYEFKGWSLTADGEILGNDTVLIPDTTYYAIFKEIATN